jgi:hypothetical protein
MSLAFPRMSSWCCFVRKQGYCNPQINKTGSREEFNSSRVQEFKRFKVQG